MGAQLDGGRNHSDSPFGEEILCFSYNLKERPTQTEGSSSGRANLSSDTHQAMTEAAKGCAVLSSFLSQVIVSEPGGTEHKSGTPICN